MVQGRARLVVGATAKITEVAREFKFRLTLGTRIPQLKCKFLPSCAYWSVRRITERKFSELKAILPLAFISVVAAGVLSTCSTERTVGPNEVMSVVYMGGSYFRDPDVPSSFVRILYTMDASSMVLQDSIELDYWPQRLASNGNGRELFLQLVNDTTGRLSVRALESPGWRLLWEIQEATLASVLESGNLVAIVAHPRTPKLIDGNHGTEMATYSDTLLFFPGEYSGSEMIVLAQSHPTINLRILDVRSGVFRGGYNPRLENGDRIDAQSAVLHPNGKHVYVIGRRSSNSDSWLTIGDVESDSTILSHRMVYPYGEIAISRDGVWAAVTDPSSPFHDSRRTLDVFDARTPTHAYRFSEPEFPAAGQVRFAEDSGTLFSFPRDGSTGPVQKIDLIALRVSVAKWLPTGDTARTLGFGCSTFDVAVKP